MNTPGYWMNETSGVLEPAVKAYLLTQEPLSPEHVGALRAYLRQWMLGPWRGPEVDQLRRQVDSIATRADIDAWSDQAYDLCIDPW